MFEISKYCLVSFLFSLLLGKMHVFLSLDMIRVDLKQKNLVETKNDI